MKSTSMLKVAVIALMLMAFGREAVAVNAAPTVATPAAASPSPVTTGTTTALSVLGADDAGEAALTYTWDVNMALAPAAVTFSANGTNAARSATATFTKAGWYLLRTTIRDAGSLTVTSSVWVEVRQAVTSLVNLPASASVSQRSVTAFTGDMRDQFGGLFLTQPLFTWTKSSTDGLLLSANSYVMDASGSDIWNTSDGFRFAHQSLTGDGTITAKIEKLGNTDAWAKAGVMMRDGLAANAVNAMTNVTAASGALFQRRVAVGGVTVNTIIAGQAAPTWVRLQRVGNTFTGSYSPDGTTWTVITSEVITMGPTLYVGLASTAHNTARLTRSVFSNVTVTTPSTTAVAPDSPWIQQDITSAATVGLAGSSSYLPSTKTFTVTGSGRDIWDGEDGFRFVHQPLTGDATLIARVVTHQNTHAWAKAGVMIRDGLAANAREAMVNVTATAGVLFQYRPSVGATTVHQDVTPAEAPIKAMRWLKLTRKGDVFTGFHSADGQSWTWIWSTSVTMAATVNVGLAVSSHTTTTSSTATFDNVSIYQGADSLAVPLSPWRNMDIGTTVPAGATRAAVIPGVFFSDAMAPGSVTLTSSASGRTANSVVTVANTAPTVVVAANATPSPATGTTTALKVVGGDDLGEEGLIYTWATTGTPPAAVTFSANGTNAAKNVTATFTKAGAYNFQVTIRDAGSLTTTSSVAVTVNQTITTVVVTPASATVATGATQTYVASARDQFATTLTTQPTFTWTVSGGGTISTAGLFSATTAGGPFTVTAAAGGRSGTATVTVTTGGNTPPTVATAAAATPSPVVGTTTVLSALGADNGGEPALIYTWATTGTPPAAVTFSANGTNAAKSSTATFTKAGTYGFQVTIRDAGSLTVTSSVSVTVNATLTTVAMTPVSASIFTGVQQTITASARDQFGTTLTTQPTFTWSATGTPTVTGVNTFTWPTAGTYTVTASASGKTGTSTVTVTTNTAPTVATAAAATPSPVVGTTTVLSALGADTTGGEPALIYTWATTGTPPAAVTFSANGTNAAKSSTATFTKAGTYAFQVTIRDAGNLTVTSSVSVVVNATLTTVAVTPASATVNTGSTQAFAASGRDQFATTLTTQPTFTWTVSGGGTISSAGLFSATTAGGPFTVTATSGTKSGTAAVTVTANTPPTVATGAIANPNPTSGTTAALSVLGADNGGEAALTYTWATTGTPPASVAFSVNGTNAAKNSTATFTKIGTYAIQVTIRDAGNLTVTSSVSVVVSPALTTIVVTPASATVNTGSTQAFVASGRDQFATTLTTQPTFTWTVSGGGTISTAGLFSATTAGGPFTVTATSGTKNGTASVTVTAPTNTPPLVTLTSPADNAVVAPGTVTLTATASDPGGSVAKVEFFNGSTKLGEDLSSPYSYAWASVPAGTYPLMAQATDNLGMITSTSYISVTVGTNAIPVADFSLSNTSGSLVVTFDGGLSSDPDGDMLSAYAWTFSNVASGQPTTSTLVKPVITFNSAAASFVITLRVTDSHNAQSTLLSRTYTLSQFQGGNQPPPQESDDKKIIYVGDTTSFTIDMTDNKATATNWSQSGDGQVLFYDSNGGACNEWKPSHTNNLGDYGGSCYDGIEVKGSQPGKVTISVYSTPHTTEGTCGGASGPPGPPGSSVSKTYEVTVLPRPEPPPKMPLGSKYRRVDVHGIPMPDPSPTGEGESDRVPNMAYTDMFSMSPTYATTDVNVPVDGGELSLEFRRTMSVKSRNYNTDLKQLGITYASDDLLGLGWDTNLGGRVIVTERKNKAGTPYLVADVTDEVGSTYGYVISGGNFYADLGHSFNNEAIKARVAYDTDPANPGGIVLTKPHGTKVVYRPIPRVFFAPFSSGSACGGSIDVHKEIYYTVKSVIDRNGNRLDFTYNVHREPEYEVVNGQSVPKAAPVGEGPNGDLVVKKITFVNNGFAADTKRALTIVATWHTEYAENAVMHLPTGRDSGWRIDKVVDPLGREVNYVYTPQTTPISPYAGLPSNTLTGLLQQVRRPAVADFVESSGTGVNDSSTAAVVPTVSFTYHIQDLRDVLMDPVNPPAMDGNIGINRFVAPATITDARGHVTSMTYQPDWFPVNYYPGLGSFVWQYRIRLKTMGTAADGTANFNMPAFPNAFVINPGAGSIDLTTDVTDVRGVKTTFKFAQKLVLVPNEIGAAMYVTKFERTTDGTSGNGNTGKTVFDFSDPFGLPDPNGNLTKVTDMSGNVIQFVYRSGVAGDTFDQGMTLPSGALNGYYNPNYYMAFNKPAKRIVDPGGLNLVTEYRYNKDRFNKQSEEIDAEGKRTVYVFDTKGNRTEVQEAVGTPVARTAKYAYAANGFVTQVTDPDNRVTTHALTFNTTATVAVPPSMADTAGETVPLEQAYQQVISTVKGYANELTLTTTGVSDIMGGTRWVTDPRTNVTRMYYDALNRPVKTKMPAVVNTAGATVTSISEAFYDLNGNVRKQTDDEGNAAVTTYDAMNRATKVRVRMTNATQNTDTTDLITQTNYRHGSDTGTASVGLPRFTMDAMGNRTDYNYDNLLRLTTTTFPSVTLPDTTSVRYTKVNTYGKNSGSGAFAYWSGWLPVRVKDKRGYYTDSTFDKIYRPTRVVQRASTTPPALDATGTPPAPGTGEPTTETFYTKTHKPIRQVTWTENWANSASYHTTWTTYDSLYRVSAVVVDGNNGNGTVTAVTAPETFTEDGIAYANGVTNVSALVTATKYILGTVSTPAQTIARDALGRQTTSTLDGAGRVTQVVQPVVRVIDPKGYNPNDTDLAPTTIYTYDPNGNCEIVEDANHVKTKTTYDARNRPVQVIVDLNLDNVTPNVFNSATYNGALPIPTNIDLVTSTRYNLKDRPVKVTNSRGYVTDTVYDKAYRILTVTQPTVTDAQAPGGNIAPVITHTYDKNGNLLTIQDARQKAHTPTILTVKTYDELNRLRTNTEASGGSATTEVLKTETQYDPNGNVLFLLCFNSAGSGGTQTTSYTYDAYNRKLTETLPTVADALLRRTTWTYYRNHAARTATDAKSQVHEQEYDRAGRQTRSRHKLVGGTTDETRTLTYSKTSKPLTIADKSGTTTNAYDAFDRVATETRATTGQTSYTVQNGYDAVGQRTRVIYPATNRTTLNSFDRGGRLVTTGDSKGSRNTTYAYDTVGNRLTITEPAPNSVVTTNTYDALNRCTRSWTRKGSTPVSDYDYAFDLVGNRLTVTENIALQGSRVITYAYDARYQLLSEAWTGYSNTYTYDLAGNRLTKVNVVGSTTTTTTSTYDALNRLLTATSGGVATSFTYDRNGNQETQTVSGTTHTVTWDVHNRLLSVVQGSNLLAATYDYRTRRETTNVNGAGARFFRYDQGVSFHELVANALQVEFLRGPELGGGIGSILSSDRTMVGGTEETFAYNPAVGHVTAVTDTNGATTDSDRYDAFGNIIGALVGSSQNNRFANTKERNTVGTLVLDNHGFRYYNPVTGRYLNRDPIGYGDGVNVYAYVKNNPINRIDPLGLFDLIEGRVMRALRSAIIKAGGPFPNTSTGKPVTGGPTVQTGSEEHKQNIRVMEAKEKQAASQAAWDAQQATAEANGNLGYWAPIQLGAIGLELALGPELFAGKALAMAGKAGRATKVAEEGAPQADDGYDMALGLFAHKDNGSQLLNKFSGHVGGKTYKDLSGSWDPGTQEQFMKAMDKYMGDAKTIHFNLDQFKMDDFMKYAADAAKNGARPTEHNMTNYELYKILTNPELKAKTKFYKAGGAEAPAPKVKDNNK